MDITFGLKFGLKVEVWFLKLLKVFFELGQAICGGKVVPQYWHFVFFCALDLNSTVNSFGS